MSRVVKLRLTYEVLTPLYMGGADQNAELRPPSIKGLMRYWWRTVNPLNLREEPGIFGGAGARQGQSPFSLTMDSPLAGKAHWDKALARRFDIKPEKKQDLPQNGLAYLGYPFKLENEKKGRDGTTSRSCIEPGQSLKLSCIFTGGPTTPGIRQGVAASAWLLGHFGGAGSRSRRGFGSLALVDWQIQGSETWEEMKSLPLLHERTTPEGWMAGYDAMRRILREEDLPAVDGEEIHHPHFGKDTCLVLGDSGYAKEDWAGCLNEMGLAMQRFRQRREPDRGRVKSSLQGRGLLQYTPDRASFGLPLAFRLGNESLEIISKDGDRHGSLLHLCPVLIGGKLYPLYLRLAGAVPGENPPGRVRGHPDSLESIGENAMDLFMKQLQGVTRHG